MADMRTMHHTTIIGLYSAEERRAVIASDGQATLDTTVIKSNASKVFRLHKGTTMVGMAGATADCVTLMDRLDGKLGTFDGRLRRAAVEMTKEWRTDKMLRRLDALVVAVSRQGILMISGAGDVLEPDENVVGIGSGGAYALSAAKALLAETSLSIADIARRSLQIAGAIDIYTNTNISMEELSW